MHLKISMLWLKLMPPQKLVLQQSSDSLVVSRLTTIMSKSATGFESNETFVMSNEIERKWELVEVNLRTHNNLHGRN